MAEAPAACRTGAARLRPTDGFIDGPQGEFDRPSMGPQLSADSEGLGERVGILLYGRPVGDMMVGLPGEIAALKAEDGGDILLTGGAALAAALTEAGLVDEYHIAVHPVVLGGGRPLFGRPPRRLDLRTEESRTLDRGVVVTRYRLVGGR
ncbi:dihydrofolate reductase family protein [Dactylosporangium sp. CA-139114]|uniref:dihydrofolate reductase family protein n=1 Tax=Dactylosporangium sp. CA-139114 TaxID=3239931 RepID=UPI003D979141